MGNKAVLRSAFVLLAVGGICPSVAAAQLAPETHSDRRLITECKTAVDTNSDATPFAVEMREREGFDPGPRAYEAARCASAAFPGEWAFIDGSFVNLTALEQSLEQAEVSRQVRQEAVDAILKEECRSKFRQDRFIAVTTPACYDLFVAIGLPE